MGFKFVSILFPFALVAFIFWLIARDRKMRYEMDLDLYRKANEKEGKPPMVTVIRKPKKTNLEKGIIFISIGIGIFLFFVLATSMLQYYRPFPFEIIGATGIIPFTVGAGLLFIHFLERKKDDQYRKNEK